MDTKIFSEDDILISYGIKEAEEDGVLFNIFSLNKDWEKGIFSHVTDNLLSKGYYEKNGEIRIVNLLDLLNQANQIVRRKSNNFKEFDNFFDGRIKLANGEKQKILIRQNELNKFTIMLLEDD